MLYLSKRKELAFSDWIKTINIIPVSISYEYDPLDITKAKGWDHQEEMSPEEINESDLNELAKGLFGHNGRVHLHVCDPINYEGGNIEDFSLTIEHEILSNYKIWPTSHIAAKMLNNLDSGYYEFDEEQIKLKSENQFLNRFNGLEKKVQIDCLQAYVRPMVNKKKVRGEL